MIEYYDLGKIYEFSNDELFINKTVGLLVDYDMQDTKDCFEFYPLLKDGVRDTEFSTYCRDVRFETRNYLFGEVKGY